MSGSSLTPDLFDGGSGERLRRARVEAGLSISDVAERLKLKSRVIENLEAERWEALDAPVFVRGQLKSYAKLLGITLELESGQHARLPVAPATIQPRTYTPPLRRMTDKMMGRMVYVVITGLIVVPVWMATRSHFNPVVPHVASLDVSPTDVMGANAAVESTEPRTGAASPRTLTASMAGLSAKPSERGSTTLALVFGAESWVEINDVSGGRLEHGLVVAGERREFPVADVGNVVLGNADSVEVHLDGRVQDLSDFQRANVARFKVSSDGSLQSLTD